jgi:hypothetical protein
MHFCGRMIVAVIHHTKGQRTLVKQPEATALLYTSVVVDETTNKNTTTTSTIE